VDSTEEVREREALSQQQMSDSNRIVAGAVAHEVRNFCGAMSVYYSKLLSVPGMAENGDCESLGKLISGLERLATLELHGRAELHGGNGDLTDVINQLRILIGPSLEEAEAAVRWPKLDSPVIVAADSFILLQACLNLSQNSLSAMSASNEKLIKIGLRKANDKAYVTFEDSGCGVANPEQLFQPFRSGSGHVGLGLYVSRALMRRYGGDVRYEAVSAGARFLIEVPLSGVDRNVSVGDKRHQNPVGG
jgi:two-component system, LuxR family, sensor kinase FixL